MAINLERSLFELMFGFSVTSENKFGVCVGLIIAFILALLAVFAIITSITLNLTHKVNFKVHLGVSIGIAVILIAAGILFLFTKRLWIMGSLATKLGISAKEAWENMKDAFRITASPIVVGSLLLVVAVAYPVTNILINRK